jgi:hypothetical protein
MQHLRITRWPPWRLYVDAFPRRHQSRQTALSKPSSIVALVSVTGNGLEPNPSCLLVSSSTVHLRDDLSSANGSRPVALLATPGLGAFANCRLLDAARAW